MPQRGSAGQDSPRQDSLKYCLAVRTVLALVRHFFGRSSGVFRRAWGHTPLAGKISHGYIGRKSRPSFVEALKWQLKFPFYDILNTPLPACMSPRLTEARAHSLLPHHWGKCWQFTLLQTTLLLEILKFIKIIFCQIYRIFTNFISFARCKVRFETSDSIILAIGLRL